MAVHVPTAAEMNEIGRELADSTLNEVVIDGLRALVRQAAYQKRRAEEGLEDDNPNYKQPLQPRQLESLLLSSQVNSLCDHVGHTASESIVKLFLLGGLKRDEAAAAAALSALSSSPSS
eukprot:m51a1_g1961 hypothetical protein (119) ;mRNA; f:1068177-1072673